MAKSGDILTHESLVWLCSVINQTANLGKDIILDTAIQTSSTYSSYLIENKLNNLKEENEKYVEDITSRLNKLTKEVINDTSLVTKDNVLYLYKADTDTSNNYMQMMLINGQVVSLGDTQANFDNIYTKTESDSKFAVKLDLDTLTTSFNNLKTQIGTDPLTTTAQTLTGGINELNNGKLDKTDIDDTTPSTDKVYSSSNIENKLNQIIKLAYKDITLSVTADGNVAIIDSDISISNLVSVVPLTNNLIVLLVAGWGNTGSISIGVRCCNNLGAVLPEGTQVSVRAYYIKNE